MNEKQKRFESYLDEQIAAWKKRSELLVEDGRKDEGNFEKVRVNVYEIFKTVLSVAEKLCGKDDLAKKQFFLQRLEQIPMSWTASYDKAKANGDVEKMHIESIKLDTVEEIKNIFMQIEEEAI